MESKNETKFQWSLKPLLFVSKCVGLPLRWPSFSRNRPSFVAAIHLLLILIVCLIVLGANAFINRKRLIDFTDLKERLENISAFESPFVYFKANPHGLIVLINEMLDKFFFAAVPFIHLIFLITIAMTRNWTGLLNILEKMKLDAQLHRKCRKHCIAATLVLLMVRQFF